MMEDDPYDHVPEFLAPEEFRATSTSGGTSLASYAAAATSRTSDLAG